MPQNNHNNHDAEEFDDEEMELEDVVDENTLLLNALIKLLMKKKVISEQEYEKAIEELEAEGDE
ncbi:hypothetical protein HYV86_01850 [Candidatus Woesearchaeota archaeon]|nr:hypothetical protein [Candidatus Woesearchaeota archaeon]